MAKPNKTALQMRRSDALKHALEGKTFRQIGDLLGISDSQAHRDVHAAVRAHAKINEKQVMEYREVIASRYYRLLDKWLAFAEADPESKAGDKVLRIFEGLRQLYGLDKPVEKPDDAPAGGLTTVVVNKRYVGKDG